MEVYISASSDKIFLLGEDYIQSDNIKVFNTHLVSMNYSLTAKFTFNGKSYTEAAYAPTRYQLYKYTNMHNRIRKYNYITSDGYHCVMEGNRISSTILLNTSNDDYFFPAIEFSL